MLHYSTIDAKTLELLKQLVLLPEFKQLRLVGGTSLALQIGHRNSIGIDLFGIIDNELKLDQILKPPGKFHLIHKTSHIFICTINDIKVDIVNYSYPWLYDTFFSDNIPLADLEDISAMKLAAITGIGSKNDFIDIYFLLKEFSLQEMLSFYEEKYSDGALFLVLRSLTYFIGADKDADPKMLNEVSWSKIKETIILTINEYFQKRK